VIAVLNWSLNHWWVFLWLSIFGVFEGVRDFFAGIGAAILELSDRVTGATNARWNSPARGLRPDRLPAPATLPAAPCRHRNLVSVRDRSETVVAWLCKGCDARLPADFSVYEEDL
jgi:hypothetical protein